MQELVCIYATSDDVDLREVGWGLLELKLAVDADVTEQTPIWIDPAKQKRKTGAVGRAITIFVKKASVEVALGRIKMADKKARAYAMPVLASLDPDAPA